MKFHILFCFIQCILFSESGFVPSHNRTKRDAVGALRIINNHAQPIHEDVKPEGELSTEKVVPPKEGVWFEGQSLRKSSPLTNKLDIARSISRFVTLLILLISGVIEFYPMLQHLYTTIQNLVM